MFVVFPVINQMSRFLIIGKWTLGWYKPWNTPLTCITLIFLSSSSNKSIEASQEVCLKSNLNTLLMIGASMKEINSARDWTYFNFPGNSVKGVLDFSKCGIKVGAPNFRIFKECTIQVGGLFPEKHSLKSWSLRKKVWKMIRIHKKLFSFQ